MRLAVPDIRLIVVCHPRRVERGRTARRPDERTKANATVRVFDATDAACRKPSKPSAVQRALQLLEHAHDAQPAVAVGARCGAGADALDEVLALDPQRL